MLRAKTDLAGQSPSELLLRDAKAYRINNIHVLLSQIEVSDITDISPLLPSLQQEMGKIESSKEFEFVALIVTDITKANSTVYFTDSKFIGELQVYLPNMISRKKEILPWLTDLLTSSPNKR
ncbi:DHHA2 domain-containing protein [Pseudomonas aeruginosa]|uniref:DHHA2 domain-containing protein n=1 Tax=Pseudomonas aeruginosa TaxID=287 RepID=UPI003857EEA0